MNPIRIPTRRRARRFYRYRPGLKGRVLRSVLRPRNLLLVSSGVLLVFFAAWLIRSGRTAENNRTYLLWREAAETAAASAPVSKTETESGFQRMTMPDGTQITREYKQTMGVSVPDTVVSTAYHTASGSFLPGMETLRARNQDLAGWLTIDGVLDLPVVYRDNSKYLNHDFEGRKSASGTLFFDQSSPVSEKTQNLLIHGHNMKDGSMFAQITHYRSKDYWKKHPFITLSTLWEKENYVVFAVMDVPDQPDDPDYVNYFSHAVFSSDKAFHDYLDQVKAHSLFPCYLSVKPEDALLTLSTCISDHHLVVLARRFRENENKPFLRSLL